MSAREALHSSLSSSWATPPEIITPARRVLGGRIGIDPASCDLANEIVRAERYFTEETDGLAQEWDDDWFLNPPYGAGVTEKWVDRAVEQHIKHTKNGILLVNATPDRRWFQQLWNYPICFPEKRIRFLETPEQRLIRMVNTFKKARKEGLISIEELGRTFDELAALIPAYEGETFAGGKLFRGPQPTNGNAIVYLGSNPMSFAREFKIFGHIAWPNAGCNDE